MKQLNSNDIAELIRAKYSCTSLARNILGLPIFKSGDRTTSLAPGPHTHDDALVVYDDHWTDYTLGKSGDVIQLYAETRCNGDRGQAFKELGQEFFPQDFIPSSYSKHIQSLSSVISKWHSSLRPQDRQYLHERRISDTTIDTLKIGYCNDKQSGFYDRVIIPYWLNGQPVYYAGRDSSGNWKFKERKVSKYKKAWTGKNEFTENIMWGQDSLGRNWCGDVEHDTQAAFRDKYLCILEGQFDAMSFWQEKWHVLSPIGGRFSQKNLRQLRDIAKEYEAVFICFDNDEAGRKFQLFMAGFLFSHNIPFVCGHTHNPDGSASKWDISDYYSHGGDLAQLVREATPGVQELAASFEPGQELDFQKFILKAGRYVSLSTLQLFCGSCKLDRDFVMACLQEAKRPPHEKDVVDEIAKDRLIAYQDGAGFYEYDHGAWNFRPNVAIEAIARGKWGNFATAQRITGTVRHLRIVTWTEQPFNQHPLINCMNGMVDPATGELSDHNPVLYSSLQLPRIYDRDAKAPRFSQFLDEITGGDKQKRRLILQMMGSPFVRDSRFQTAFMLMGDGANGKSVLMEIMRSVIDPRNCSNVELSKFADNFDPIRLMNSLVNFCTETRADLRGSESIIKRVISGETISAARKGVDAVEFAPHCKIICACNQFVASKDISYAFVRRCKFIGFNKTFKGPDADKNLLDKLKKEAAGILNMMIEGYQDLMRTGGYVETAEEERLKLEFMNQANPLSMFIGDTLRKLRGEFTVSELFTEHYVPWAEKAKTGVMSLPNFGAAMKKLMPQLIPDAVFNTKRNYAHTWILPGDVEYAEPDPDDKLPGYYAHNTPEHLRKPKPEPAPKPEPKPQPKPQQKNGVMSPEKIEICRMLMSQINAIGVEPGDPSKGGAWWKYDTVNNRKLRGKVQAANPQGWIQALELVKDALHQNGYPCTTKHAVKYWVMAGNLWYQTEDNSAKIIAMLKEHPEYV